MPHGHGFCGRRHGVESKRMERFMKDKSYLYFPFTVRCDWLCRPTIRRDPLQRTNTENSKQIFPEKELRALSPNFHIHVFVSDLYVYITAVGLPNLQQEICGPILGIYKSLTDTSMWKLGLRPRNSQKRNMNIQVFGHDRV